MRGISDVHYGGALRGTGKLPVRSAEYRSRASDKKPRRTMVRCWDLFYRRRRITGDFRLECQRRTPIARIESLAASFTVGGALRGVAAISAGSAWAVGVGHTGVGTLSRTLPRSPWSQPGHTMSPNRRRIGGKGIYVYLRSLSRLPLMVLTVRRSQ
jgi:hypothetical protein